LECDQLLPAADIAAIAGVNIAPEVPSTVVTAIDAWRAQGGERQCAVVSDSGSTSVRLWIAPTDEALFEKSQASVRQAASAGTVFDSLGERSWAQCQVIEASYAACSSFVEQSGYWIEMHYDLDATTWAQGDPIDVVQSIASGVVSRVNAQPANGGPWSAPAGSWQLAGDCASTVEGAGIATIFDLAAPSISGWANEDGPATLSIALGRTEFLSCTIAGTDAPEVGVPSSIAVTATPGGRWYWETVVSAAVELPEAIAGADDAGWVCIDGDYGCTLFVVQGANLLSVSAADANGRYDVSHSEVSDAAAAVLVQLGG
jgi:hypothetical protein